MECLDSAVAPRTALGSFLKAAARVSQAADAVYAAFSRLDRALAEIHRVVERAALLARHGQALVFAMLWTSLLTACALAGIKRQPPTVAASQDLKAFFRRRKVDGRNAP